MKNDKQTLILQLMYSNGGTATKKEINDVARGWYYLNHDKHVQAVLSTMVKNRLIHRLSKGVYALGVSGNAQITPKDKNQTSLF